MELKIIASGGADPFALVVEFIRLEVAEDVPNHVKRWSHHNWHIGFRTFDNALRQRDNLFVQPYAAIGPVTAAVICQRAPPGITERKPDIDGVSGVKLRAGLNINPQGAHYILLEHRTSQVGTAVPDAQLLDALDATIAKEKPISYACAWTTAEEA